MTDGLVTYPDFSRKVPPFLAVDVENENEWTEKRPDAPGLYRAIPRLKELGLVWVELVEKPDGNFNAWVPGDTRNYGWTLEIFTHWLGPLTVPEPPTE